MGFTWTQSGSIGQEEWCGVAEREGLRVHVAGGSAIGVGDRAIQAAAESKDARVLEPGNPKIDFRAGKRSHCDPISRPVVPQF